MTERDLINPFDQIHFVHQRKQPFSRCIQRMEWHPYDSMWTSFAEHTFNPRNLIFRQGDLKTKVERNQGLIGDEAAQSENLDIHIPRLTGEEWEHIIQPLKPPFSMNFRKDDEDEVLKTDQELSELLGVRDHRTVW